MSPEPSKRGSGPGPKVFITYRREETSPHAGRLYDAMVARYGEDNVFMDVDMAPGIDFVERITDAVAACEVLIVVMGPRWATVENEKGTARIADPEDFVRLELETALRRPDVTPIPVLVSGAQMPNREDLPSEVQAITRRNAVELSDQRWRSDVGRLISTLDELIAEPPLISRAAAPDRGVASEEAAPADTARAAGGPPATAAATSSVETEPAAPPGSGRRRLRWALLGVTAIVAVVVAVVVVAGGGDGSSDPSPSAASDARVDQTDDVAPEDDSRSRSGSQGDAIDDGYRGDWPDGSAYAVILGSERTRGEAASMAKEVLSATGAGGGILFSSEHANLTPGYWVAYAGPFGSLDEARESLGTFRPLVPDAYTRYVSAPK